MNFHRLVTCIGTLLFLSIFALGPSVLHLEQVHTRWWTNGFWTLASFAAALHCFYTARYLSHWRLRHAWICFGLGCLFWFLGMLVWDYLELVKQQATPFPALSDLGYLALPFWFVIGFYHYSAVVPRRQIDIKQLCNLGILFCAMMGVVGVISFAPVQAINETWLYALTAMAHPILHMWALFYGLICLWLYVLGRERVAFVLMVLAMAIFTAVSVLYATALLNQSYQTGSSLDIYWLIGFLAIVAAAREQHFSSYTAGIPHSIHDTPVRIKELEAWLPTLAMLSVGLVAYFYRMQLDMAIWYWMLPVFLGLVACIGVREWWSIRLEAELQHSTRRSAEELRALNRFLERILADSPILLMLFDQQGQIRIWNSAAEAITGYTHADVLDAGPAFWGYLYPDPTYRETTATATTPILLTGGVLEQYETTIHRKDGRTRRILWSARGLLDGDDQPNGAIVFGLDITERIEAEEQRRAIEQKLQETQKLESLGVLAGGIAHDFNNLLTAILGHAELALLDLAPDTPAGTSVEQVAIATRRAADLTRQLLAYAGKGRFVVEPINLSLVVQEMVHLLQVSVPKTVELEIQLADQLPSVDADVTQIRQVVMNLVVNAADAIGEQRGNIKIKTGHQYIDEMSRPSIVLDSEVATGPYVYFAVTDTGAGMDVVTQARIFDPFFTTKATGRGLGLAAVQGIVRGHNGALAVESTPGQGSTFTIFLPASAAPEVLSVPQQRQNAKGHGTGVILVVDDEESVRTVMRGILERLGYQILLAEHGQAGVELLRIHASAITCVLLDMSMPVLNGKEAFRLMRQIKPDLQVVFMSGYNEQEETNALLGEEHVAFLQKPFTSSELWAKIRNM